MFCKVKFIISFFFKMEISNVKLNENLNIFGSKIIKFNYKI